MFYCFCYLEFNPANYNDHLIKAFGRDSPYHRDYSGMFQYKGKGGVGKVI